MRACALHTLKRLLKDEGGPTATEYAVMLGLVILVAVVSINQIGLRIWDLYDVINAATGS